MFKYYKHNKIHILLTVFNMSSHNLLCVSTMILWIRFVILVAMDAIFTGKNGLPSYQHTHIYKMKMCHLLAIPIVIIYMSTEPSGYQHSETAVIFLNIWSVD